MRWRTADKKRSDADSDTLPPTCILYTPILFQLKEDIIMTKWHEAVGSVPLLAPQGLFCPLCSWFPSFFAAGRGPSEAPAQAATQRDGRSHIIDWTLDKRSWGPPSAVGPSSVSLLPSMQPHTHTHTTVSPASATWGISRDRKQANHSFLFLFLFLP